MRIVFVVFAICLLSLAALPWAHASDSMFLDPRALSALERFERTWRSAQGASYRIVKTERLRDGDLIVEELAVKFQKPGRAYVYMHRPIEGREIIYDRTKNKAKLTVHNGRFPDLTLSLGIHGALATQNQHHTIDSLGFDQALKIFRSALEVAKREPQGERLVYLGEGTFAGRPVEKVSMNTGKRPARKETARDESLFEFAARVGQDAYVIYGANPRIRSLTSNLDTGESYVVPPYYAKRCESWHDKQTGMPLKQVMYDDKGDLYESYEHYDLVLDPTFSDQEFDPENPKYGF